MPLVTAVGLAAHLYGATATRIQRLLSSLASALGFQGLFRSTPTELVICLRADGDPTCVPRVVSAPAPGMDLDKLAEVCLLVEQVIAGSTEAREVFSKLKEIAKKPAPWSSAPVAISYPAIGAGVVVVLSGAGRTWGAPRSPASSCGR